MITLEEVKEHLRIDYPDNDELIELLISATLSRAEAITGIPLGECEELEPNIKRAMLDDISRAYSGKNFDSSINTYRQHSTRPML